VDDGAVVDGEFDPGVEETVGVAGRGREGILGQQGEVVSSGVAWPPDGPQDSGGIIKLVRHRQAGGLGMEPHPGVFCSNVRTEEWEPDPEVPGSEMHELVHADGCGPA
jgi:hypothetical protein